MGCLLSISSVTATLSSGTVDSLTISGSVSQCPNIRVSVVHGTSITKIVSGSTTSGNWTAVFSGADLAGFNVSCGDTVEVNAQCTTDFHCATAHNEVVVCCPTVDIQIEQGDCKDDGTQPVTITATISPNGAIAQADLLLDGSVVASATSTFASLTLSYSADLPSGTHTACVQINQPDCGQQCTTFEVKCPQIGDGDGEDSYECTHTYKRWFCPLLFVIMTVGLGIAFALLVLLSCPALVGLTSACSSNLATLATLLLLVGFIALGLFAFFPDCRKCVCGWMEKFFWRILFGVGLVTTEFGGCCPTGLTGGPILIGLGLLALYLWIRKCKPSVCDVVKDAILVIAAIVIPVTVLILACGGFPCLYTLFTIGSSAFTVADLTLVILFALILYDQTNC